MGVAQTDTDNVNPIALVFLLAMAVVTLRAERHNAVKALLAIAAFLPLGQQFVILGLHFQFFRILILIGMLRVVIRKEYQGFSLTTMDRAFVGWALACLLCGIVRDPSKIMGISCFGGAFNSFGAYFLMRFLIRDMEEVLEQMRLFALVAVVIAATMAVEVTTHRNLFSIFGGVTEFVGERDGRFRCQGPFRHPILAGTFAATLLPVLIGLWFSGKRNRMLAIPGILGCTFSALAAASSGAIMTCLTAMVGFGLWPLRNHMTWVRRSMVGAIFALAMTMNAPVYYLIAKLSEKLGGTGWHRSYLIDKTIEHFNEWWLFGTGVTAHWAPAGEVLAIDKDNMDITNHYIWQGLRGGIWGLGFFIVTIVIGFKIIGRVVRAKEEPTVPRKVFWALGVSLACHSTAFISISYFDQIEVFWYWLLAVIACLPAYAAVTAKAQDKKPDAAEDFSEIYAAVPQPRN